MKKRCMALFMALTVFAGQISGSALTAFAEDTGVQTEIAAAEASAETTAEEVSAEEQEILTKATAEPQEQETAPAETGPVEAENAQVPAEEQAPAAAEDTKIPAETQESTASEDAQTAAEEQVSATTADAQTAEAAPAEDYVEEAAVVGDAEELPQEESAEDAGAQDTTDGENAPFDPAAINLADSQISVEEASIEADPMLAEEELPDYYFIGNDVDSAQGYAQVYRGVESCTFQIMTANGWYNDKTVNWNFGVWTEDENQNRELNEEFKDLDLYASEGNSITVYPWKIPMGELLYDEENDSYSFQIQAVISEDGEEKACPILWVDVRWDDNYNYYFTENDNEYREENDNTTIYTDAESYTFSLASALENPFNEKTVKWELGIWEENRNQNLEESLEDAYDIDEEQKTITVYPDNIPLEAITRTDEDDEEVVAFQIRVGIYPKDDLENEIASAIIWINVEEAGYDKNSLPSEDTQVVLRNECYIDSSYSVWIWNAKNPEGKDVNYDVTKIKVSYPEGSSNILSYYDEESDEWVDAESADITSGDCGLRAENPGTANVILTLSCAGEEDIFYPFTISVVGDLYYLDISRPNNGFKMAFGGELLIPTSLTHTIYNINYDEPVDEVVSDYELEVTGYEYGDDYFTATPEGQGIKITCTSCEDEDDWADSRFFVAAKVDGEIVAESDIYIEASRGYFELRPESIENIEMQLGDTYEIKPELIFCQDGEEKDVTENVTFFVEYDDYDYSKTPLFGEAESDGYLGKADAMGVITLTRQAPSWGRVRLSVRYGPGDDGIGYPINSYNEDNGPTQYFDFQELDYSDFGIEDEDAWMDRTLFIGEGESLELKAENVPEGEGYQVKWKYLRYTEEGDPVDISSEAIKAIEDENSVTLTTDGTQFIEDDTFTVRATLYYGDPEEDGIELYESEVSVKVEEPESQLRYANNQEGDMDILLNQRISFPYDETLGGYVGQMYVRNSKHPDGAIVPVLFSNFALEQDNPAVKAVELVEPTEEDDCYYVHAIGEGSATLTVTVSQAGEEEFDETWKNYNTLKFLVSSESPEDMYIDDVWTEGTEASEYLLPGDEAQIMFSIGRSYYDQERGEWQFESFRSNELPDGYELNISYDVENGDLLAVDENGVITSLGGRGDTSVILHASIEKGEEDWSLTGDDGRKLDIHVMGIYYGLQLDNPLYVKPGEKVSIPEKMMEYSLTSPHGKEYSEETGWSFDSWGNELLVNEDETAFQVKDIPQDDQPVSTVVYFHIWDMHNNHCWYRQEVVICEHELQEEVTKAPTCVDAGVKTITCSKCGYAETKEIPATGHTPGDWTTVSPATTEAPEKQQRTCTVCGTVIDERTVGEKLQPSTEAPSTPSTEAPSTPSTEATGTGSAQTPGTESAGAGSGTGAVQEPFIELNATSIPMKLKQSTKVIKVKMAEGDSIVSWESSNKKVVTVTKKGKIKAKKKGKATITVTLASGKTASFVVKVQKNKVTTKKVTGVTKKLTLAKGKKYKLTPVLKPLTSQDKITYTSSNKKVATVDKKGNIQAKGKGTAKITVKSGKKKAVCTVTVK